MNRAVGLTIFICVLALSGCGGIAKSVIGGSATGISECDKLFDKVEQKTAGKNLTANTNSPKEGAHVFLRDDIVPPLRKELAKPNPDKKDLAEKCKGAYEAFVPPADQ